MSTLLVTYKLQDSLSPGALEAQVTIPSDLEPHSIPGAIRERIRPAKSPDPSDGYRGQNPMQVQFVSIINLSKLLWPYRFNF
jgi:hypothetical protein